MQLFAPCCTFLIFLAVKQTVAAENNNYTSSSNQVFTQTKARKYNHYSTPSADIEVPSVTSTSYSSPHEFPKNTNESKGIEIKTLTNGTFESPKEYPPRLFPPSVTNSDPGLINQLLHKSNNTRKDEPTTTFFHVPSVPQHLKDEMREYELQDQLRKVQLNKQVEMIEDERITEDVLRRPHQVSQQESVVPGVNLMQGRLAAILAGVFVCISIFAYIGMLMWRRYLERRYGNRELIIENEFGNDMEYFSI